MLGACSSHHSPHHAAPAGAGVTEEHTWGLASWGQGTLWQAQLGTHACGQHGHALPRPLLRQCRCEPGPAARLGSPCAYRSPPVPCVPSKASCAQPLLQTATCCLPPPTCWLSDWLHLQCIGSGGKATSGSILRRRMCCRSFHAVRCRPRHPCSPERGLARPLGPLAKPACGRCWLASSQRHAKAGSVSSLDDCHRAGWFLLSPLDSGCPQSGQPAGQAGRQHCPNTAGQNLVSEQGTAACCVVCPTAAASLAHRRRRASDQRA